MRFSPSLLPSASCRPCPVLPAAKGHQHTPSQSCQRAACQSAAFDRVWRRKKKKSGAIILPKLRALPHAERVAEKRHERKWKRKHDAKVEAMQAAHAAKSQPHAGAEGAQAKREARMAPAASSCARPRPSAALPSCPQNATPMPGIWLRFWRPSICRPAGRCRARQTAPAPKAGGAGRRASGQCRASAANRAHARLARQAGPACPASGECSGRLPGPSCQSCRRRTMPASPPSAPTGLPCMATAAAARAFVSGRPPRQASPSK